MSCSNVGISKFVLMPCVSVMAHCYWERSLEVILGDKSHLVMYEQGGLSVVSALFV